MLIKLPKYNFSDIKIQFREKQKDYDTFENESTIVFIYGYPYSCKSDKWISSIDIYNYFLSENFDFIHWIDGVYSIIIIDKVKDTCFLIGDRYGIYSLFYYKVKKYILISDNIKEIIQTLPSVNLNHQSIFEYLNFGFKIGNKTHINGIYQFEAAKKYEIGIGLIIKKSTYWSLLGKSGSNKISNKEFCEIFNNHHQRALKLENKICFPLTGGRDSRSVLSTYMANRDKIRTYTHGPEYHTDVQFAKKVSLSQNIPHNFYKLDETWYRDITSKVLGNKDIFNGLTPFLDHIHVIESLEKEQSFADLFLSGSLGNQLYRNYPFGNRTPKSMDIQGLSEFIINNIPSAFYFKTKLTSYYNNVFKGYDIEKISEQTKKAIEKKLLESIGAVKTIDYLQYFLFSTYCSNLASNSLKLTGKYFKVIGSFYHKDLLQQVRLMGLHERTNASIQDYIIKQNSSYLSRLSYYNSNRKIKYFKLIINKLSNKIIKRNIFKDPYLVDYPLWLRKHHKDFVINTLNFEKMKLKELFNEMELNKLINQFLENKSSFRNRKSVLFNFALDKFIINLISLEIWLSDVEKIKSELSKK